MHPNIHLPHQSPKRMVITYDSCNFHCNGCTSGIGCPDLCRCCHNLHGSVRYRSELCRKPDVYPASDVFRTGFHYNACHSDVRAVRCHHGTRRHFGKAVQRILLFSGKENRRSSVRSRNYLSVLRRNLRFRSGNHCSSRCNDHTDSYLSWV